VTLLAACLLVLVIFSSQRVSVFGKYYLILVNFKRLHRHFTVYEKMSWDKYVKDTVNSKKQLIFVRWFY